MAESTEPSEYEKMIAAERELQAADGTWLTDRDAPANYNWQWREVISGLMDGLPIYRAYAAAYDIDLKSESGKRQAEANGSRLMRNDKFKRLWRSVLEERGFNDEVVDWRLLELITKPSTPESAAVAAIKHFNELRGRVIKKAALTDADGNSIFDTGEFQISVIRNANQDTD